VEGHTDAFTVLDLLIAIVIILFFSLTIIPAIDQVNCGANDNSLSIQVEDKSGVGSKTTWDK